MMRTGPRNKRCCSAHLSNSPLGYVSKVFGQVTTNLTVVVRGLDPAHEEIVCNPLLRHIAGGQGKMSDPARSQQLDRHESTAWQGCVEAEQPAGEAGRVVVEGFAGNENEVCHTIGTPALQMNESDPERKHNEGKGRV